MGRLLSLLLAAALLVAGCGTGTVPPDQAAVVNGLAIPLQELTDLVEQRKSAGGEQAPDADALTRQSLSDLIQTRVLRHAATAEGVGVTDAEVEAELERTRERFSQQGGTDFEQALAQQGLTLGLLRAQLRSNLEVQRVGRKLVPDPPSSDEIAKEIAGGNRELLVLHVRHILVEDQATATEVRGQLVDGGDWKDLASRFSTDPGTKDKGGDLGFISKGRTVPEFEEAAYALAGQGDCADKQSGDCTSPVSEPVQTQFGYHVLQVVGVRVPSQEELQAGLEQRRQQAFRSWFQGKLRDADIDVNPRFGSWDAASGAIVDRATGIRQPESPSSPSVPGLGAPPPEGDR